MIRQLNQKSDRLNQSRGALLLELLVVISLLAVILSIGSQSVFVSMQSSKKSSENDVAIGLMNESMEALRSIAEEKWQNIYGVAKGSLYFATSTTPVGTWTLVSGSEVVVLNGVSYTRSVVINDVLRDDTTRIIVTSSGNADPSTQKITVTVSWPNADPLVMVEYFFRWKNKTCVQSSWVGTVGTVNAIRPCATTDYDTIDTTATTTGGTLQLI